MYLDAPMLHKALQHPLEGLGFTVPADDGFPQVTALKHGIMHSQLFGISSETTHVANSTASLLVPVSCKRSKTMQVTPQHT